jgi:hypothetical protein
MDTLANAPVWVLNGFLVLLYSAVEQWAFLVLAGLSSVILFRAPGEQRPRTLGALGLALVSSLLAPFPVPYFLLAVAGAAIVMPYIEHYNRPAIQWQGVGALGLYALIGLGFSLWSYLRIGQSLASDPMMVPVSARDGARVGLPECHHRHRHVHLSHRFLSLVGQVRLGTSTCARHTGADHQHHSNERQVGNDYINLERDCEHR